jgi:hypothetical protein
VNQPKKARKVLKMPGVGEAARHFYCRSYLAGNRAGEAATAGRRRALNKSAAAAA